MNGRLFHPRLIARPLTVVVIVLLVATNFVIHDSRSSLAAPESELTASRPAASATARQDRLASAFETAERELLARRAEMLPQPEMDPDRVALFGRVVSLDGNTLIIHIFEPFTGGDGLEILSSESLPGLGIDGRRVTVSIQPGALIEVTDDDLSSLAPATPILVCGSVSGNDLAARAVFDLRLAKPYEPAPGELTQRQSPDDWRQLDSTTFTSATTESSTAHMGLAQAAADAQAGPVTLDFPGRFGGPTYEYYKEFDPHIPIWVLPPVEVKAFRFIAALDGWTYDFPFSFQANSPQLLVVGEDDTVVLNVQPQPPAGGLSSFYGGLGVNLSIYLRIWALEWYDYTANLNLLSMINSSQEPAPMPGETLNVPAQACADLTLVGIPGVPVLALAQLGICNSFVFTGDYFYADVSTDDGVVTSPHNDLAFDGTNAIDVTVTPDQHPLRLKLDDLQYWPDLDYGLFARLKIVYVKVWDSPSVTLTSGYFAAIPPDEPGECPLFEIDGTCGVQPTSIELSLPVNRPPVVTLTGLDNVNEGDITTYTFTVTDPDGDAVSLVTGYPHCGAKGLLQGTPVLDDGQFQCAFPDGPGTTTLAMKAKDEHGTQCEEVILQVTLHNVDPSVDAGADQTIDEGDTVSLDPATFSDPGFDCPACTPPSQENFTALVKWGEGTEEPGTVAETPGGMGVDTTGTVSGSHAYGDNGLFTVAVSVTDDDSGEGSNTLDITVNNVSPTAQIDESGTILINGIPTFLAHAGEVLDFSGHSTDPGSDDLFLSWDWDDGLPSPDVTTTYLVNPPFPDALPSPNVQPRDETDAKSHAFADARPYSIGFLADDDDGGHSEDSSNVIIVANADETRTAGYWLHQCRHKGKTDFDESALGSYLAIVGYMSQTFDEARDASTVGHAQDVLWVKRNEGSMHEILDRQLLAAWLNFANGSIEYDELVDTTGDGIGDTVFADAMATAEAVRLDSGATRAALEAQKDILEGINSID